MATQPAPQKWTYDEFARVQAPEGHRVEIIAGELYVSPSPVPCTSAWSRD